jgi:hypothetical protein
MSVADELWEPSMLWARDNEKRVGKPFSFFDSIVIGVYLERGEA